MQEEDAIERHSTPIGLRRALASMGDRYMDLPCTWTNGGAVL